MSIDAAILDTGQAARMDLRPGRHVWVQVVRGDLKLNGHDLHAGDGAAVSDEDKVTLTGQTETEFLLFDLA